MSEVAHESNRLSELRLLSLSELKVDHSLREDGLDPRHVEALSELGGSVEPRAGLGARQSGHRWGPSRRSCASDWDSRRFRPNHSMGRWSTRLSNRFSATPNTASRSHSEIASEPPVGLSGSSQSGRTAGSPKYADSRPQPSEECDTMPPRTEAAHASTRVGIDGRKRPVEPGTTRQRVMKALERNPTGSLRTIAAVAVRVT